ncbi:MAG: capsid protein, partial [Candidatus Bathyarchaeota archaeon]|nr:capsid protein [Candidatus Bathyarchaeota archaeon]
MAKPLGVLSENSVVVPSSIPTNLDEMDFSFIIKHYAYLSRYTWSTSDTTGTVITSVNVQPQGYTTWSKGQVHTPLSFTANQFFRYRGSIKYRFKLVKTSFHRGRLAVAFYPGITGTYPALSSSEYVFREIVDVSQTSSFEVCCPYLVSSPWSNLGTRIGILVVYVLDPLVAPTTVSTSVDILMEVAGGDDMQFSVPTNWQYEPYAPSTAQAGVESYEETPCFALGPSISSVTDRLNTETSGESIKSLRQIIKRVFHYNSQAILIGGPGYSQIYPYAVTPVMQAATTSGVLFRDKLFSDIINLWQCAYAFSYGSLLYTFRPPGGVSPTGGDQTYVVESAAQAGLATQTGLYTGSGYSPTGALTYNTLKIEGPVELRSPNWNSGLGRSVPAQFCNAANLVSMVEPSANCTNILLGDSQAVAS